MVPRFPIALSLLLTLPIPTLPALGSIRSSAPRELTPRTIDLAASLQTSARIATDGSSFLTVWSDSPGTILGARLAPDGTLIDTTPITIGEAASNELTPAVAWGGGRYFVVWQVGYESYRGRFVAPDGALSEVIELDTGIPHSTGVGPNLAFNGRVFLVTELDRDGTDHATVVDLSGTILAASAITTGRTWGSDLVSMHGIFYFVTAVQRDVIVVPIDERANAGNPQVIAQTSDAFDLHAAARGDDFLVGWLFWNTQGAHEISAVRVTDQGAGEVQTVDAGTASLQDVVADRSGYLLLYGDSRSVLARRFDTTTSFEVRRPDGDFATAQDAASNGARTIAVLGRNGGDLFASVLVEDVVTPVALGPRNQESPALAAAGDLRLVVWSELRTAEERLVVMGMRIDANGNAVDAQPVDLSAVTGSTAVRVASNGTDWLAIWQAEGKLYGVRVRHDGTLIDATPLVLADQATPLGNAIAVAWDGTSYVALYESGEYFRPAGLLATLYAVRVAQTGAHVTANGATAIRIAGSSWYTNPAIASGPNGSLIVWNEVDTRLRGALLSSGGGTVTPLAFPSDPVARPAVARNGDTFLVAGVSPQNEIRLFRADANGNVRMSYAAIPAPANAAVAVESFGEAFLVYWTSGGDLFAAVVNGEGFIAERPARIGQAVKFGAAGAQFATQQTIDHPTRPTRVFLQSLEWTPEIAPKRRSARF